ncbi:MAG: hypothetical protein QF894_12810 [Alphaproteobacteria bacterium]|nr:hypothetical protein [Alphaproteobacteria bacterium]
MRGGSWENSPRNMRSANRNWVANGLRSNSHGFRVVRSLP